MIACPSGPSMKSMKRKEPVDVAEFQGDLVLPLRIAFSVSSRSGPVRDLISS